MMSGTPPVVKNAATSTSSQQDSENTEELYHASQLEEYFRIRKLLKFVRVEDALNTSIWKMLFEILKKEPSNCGMEFAVADIDDMSIELPSVERIPKPEFFSRPALIFRLLRRTLQLYHVNSISREHVESVEVPVAELKSPRMLEYIWILLFVGAQAPQITECLTEYQKSIPFISHNRARKSNRRPIIRNSENSHRNNKSQDARAMNLDIGAAAQNSSFINSHTQLSQAGLNAAAKSKVQLMSQHDRQVPPFTEIDLMPSKINLIRRARKSRASKLISAVESFLDMLNKQMVTPHTTLKMMNAVITLVIMLRDRTTAQMLNYVSQMCMSRTLRKAQ